jgi:hypothetical protein
MTLWSSDYFSYTYSKEHYAIYKLVYRQRKISFTGCKRWDVILATSFLKHGKEQEEADTKMGN